MDDPGLDPRLHAQALRGLARLNRVSGVAWTLWKEIEPLAREAAAGGRTLSILDVATGSADGPLALAELARRNGLALELHACDISPRALEHAQERARGAGVALSTFVCDLVGGELPQTYDVVTCSLFLHHLDEEDVVRVLGAMRRAARGMVLISDLLRCRRGLALAAIASRVFSRSPVVHTDAVLSVRAAWTIEELRAMAARAGMPDARVVGVRPCRMLLEWMPGARP